jgi:ribosomal protein S12 methylthiotransferase accessory factor
VIAFAERAPKAPGLRDRCVPLEETERFIPLLRRRFGITRVGDTTRLDRTGIPTYCAMVPKSPDILGVYNGKGRTLQAARVGAVMEALERQAAANAVLSSVRRSVHDACADLYLDLGEVRPELRGDEVDCVSGTDLVTGADFLVPHCLVRFPWRGPRLLKKTSTNGLAAGNDLLEAVYHALTEMIERHVWSLYYVRSELVPRLYRGMNARDRCLAGELAFPTKSAQLDDLEEAITGSGLRLRVVILEEPLFPLVVLASVLEPESNPPMAHIGLGCSLSPAHAVERAMTEAIQSRVVDVQAAREDILRAEDSASSASQHARRLSALPRDRWYIDLPTHSVQLSDYADAMSDDLRIDVHRVVGSMRTAGIRRAVVVDISPPEQPFAVVRVCAPDFETAAVDGRLSRIALDQFNPFSRKGIVLT